MRIERTLRSAVPAERVYRMSIMPEFQERKCRDAGALSWDVEVSERGDGADGALVKTRRTLPTTGFPSILRKLVPSGVVSTEHIEWGPADADGVRVARLEVRFPGSPAIMTGTLTLRPDGASASTMVVNGEFKAHVPLLGSRIEKFATPIIVGVIDSEQRTGLAWAEEHPA